VNLTDLGHWINQPPLGIFSVPLAPRPNTSMEAGTITEPIMKQCLIIDDDPDDQEIFIMCLKKVNKSVSCLTSDDGVEAIDMLNSNPDYVPDYIFLDVNMPRMKGIECLKLIREIERLKDTKVFMYSTTSEGSAVIDSKNFGAEDFIIKPARTTDLKEKLAQIFGIVKTIDDHEKQ
jgi:CheY-like chemotaxis protein